MKIDKKASLGNLVFSGIIPLVFLLFLVGFIFGPGASILDLGILLPDVSIERIDFFSSEIQVTVRNTGPMAVEIAMADVNDRIQPAAIEPDRHLERFETALVRIPFEWNEGEPYTVGITVNDGTRFEKGIEAATEALKPSLELVGFFTLIGTYVGIIPVMIGLFWLPFIKKISKKNIFFLALTVGLLLFLAFDSIEEAFDVSKENLAGIFNGGLLIITITVLSFIGLYYSGERFLKKAETSKFSKPLAIALMISIGIGLHNFGEGLAIGSAVSLGSLAFSTFLIVGFAIHNTTEGIAIASPISKDTSMTRKKMIEKLFMLGLIAGSPAIFGVWIGGFVYSPFTSVIFLSIGAGAIFQVIITILKWIMQDQENSLSSTPVVSGIGVGMVVMYLTSILV